MNFSMLSADGRELGLFVAPLEIGDDALELRAVHDSSTFLPDWL